MSMALSKMRFGGSWVVHLVPYGSDESLCGRKPRSVRGRWKHEPQWQPVTCNKCLDACNEQERERR